MRTLTLVLLGLLIAFAANAQSLDPQAVTRVGIHSLAEEGVGMLGWNPAALGPDRGYNGTVELPSFNMAIGNNAFGVGFYNDMFTGEGTKFLDSTDKIEILDAIPDDGMSLNVHAGIPGLGFTYRNFGFRAGVESSTRGTMPKDLARLVWNGNEMGRQYSIDDLLGESQTYADFAAGYSYKFDQTYLPEIYAGLSLHYYQGLALMRTERTDGNFLFSDVIGETSIQTEGVIHSVTSYSGSGVGFDLGGMAVINNQWEAGLALRQIGGKLTWDVEDNNLQTWYSDSTGLDPAHAGEGDENFHSVDTTYTGGTVETKLPLIIQMNGLYRALPNLTLLGDMAIRTSTTSQGKGGMEVGVAAQYKLAGFFVPQLGVSLGGPFGSRFGLGAGFHFGHYDLDLGTSWVGGAFNGAKGVGFGLSQRIKF